MAGSGYVVIKLILSDSVVSDKLTTQELVLDVTESERLRKQLILQKNLTREEIEELVGKVYGNSNRLL